MHHQLNQIIAQQRHAELIQTADRARLAAECGGRPGAGRSASLFSRARARFAAPRPGTAIRATRDAV